MERESENSNNIGHDTCPFSPQPSTSGFSCVTTDTEAARNQSNHENLVIEDDDLAFLDAYDEPVSANFWTEPYLTDVSYVPPPSEATVPFVHEPDECFSPIWDVEFWGHNSLYQECGALFY